MSESKGTIYGLGETVFDIIFKDYQPQAAKPGGSAFNAMITLGRLGVNAEFISEVGNDKIGSYILQFLTENGVGNERVDQFKTGKSALSLAFLNDRSDAEYDFYKDYPNQRLNTSLPAFNSEDYLLFGSFYALNKTLRPNVIQLLKAASEAEATILYDPNFRSSHMDERDELIEVIEENMKYASLVRSSDEDMENIYGTKTSDEAWNYVKSFAPVYICTKNANGIDLYTENLRLHVEVPAISPVSTIGAGDTFNAGIMYGLYKNGITARALQRVSEDMWTDILKKAAEFSAEVCMSYENYISVRGQ